jgi:hypothetical protein
MAAGEHPHGHQCAHDHEGCGSAGPTEHTTLEDVDRTRAIQQSSDLFAYIDMTRVTAFNDGGTATRVLIPYDQRRESESYTCESIADPQLIIQVSFSVTVKITHIAVTGPEAETTCWPSTLRAYVNRDNLDFTNIEQATCSQSWSLANTRRPDVEVLYPTRPSKFQNVQLITLFFPENMNRDDSCTRIEHIGFYGTATGYRRAPVAAVYEARPLATDARSRVEVNQVSHLGM